MPAMAAPPEPAALELRGVTKTWRSRSEPVLDDVALTLQPGGLAWLAGGNGAGKTTLLRIASSLLRPDHGTVLIGGRQLDEHPRECKRELGFLAAGTSGLYARLTVRQQLDYWSRLSFILPGERDAAIDAAITRFALEPFASRRLDRMSMGERQRVRLAMAFAHGPRIALLDEPRNSLDDVGIELLARVVGEHRATGGAVLWCSPLGDRPSVACDTALLLRGGKLSVQ